MLKPTAFLLIAAFAWQYSFSQSGQIRGSVSDTLQKVNLSNSVVLLVRQSDSIMIKYARTNASGNFLLKNLPSGDFLIMVSHPGYADFVDRLHLKDSALLDLHKVGMILKSELLAEVVVTGNRGAIRIKGDTTEFRADSFKVQQGANVEELLKKLPGIQVDKNGKITAQGETVQKVLVDGEEFFGDDPTLVTQNLRADMVDKVQVFDKKSDQATFTGIDDGERTKTINLKLKDDKKNGYFGKVDAGGGTDGFYNMQAMYNMFRKKEKLSAYGIVSNTGKTGLNWQENNSYGQSFASTLDYDETMGYYFTSNSGDDLESWSGQYEGQGFPGVQTAGIHYNNKWDNEKQSINGNYKILQLQVTGSSATNSEYILPDTLYFNKQTQQFNNTILRNKVSGIYDFQFDSTTSLKINVDAGKDHKLTSSMYNSEALAKDSALVNQNTRTVSTTGDNSILNTNILLRKRLHKKGRTVSLNIRENYTGNLSDGYLLSNSNFYSQGVLSQNQLIDQYKNFNNKNLLLDSKITYSEPLSLASSLVANYGVSLDNSLSDRKSFNKSPGGKYTVLDSVYSNDYRFNVFTQRGGLSYALTKKKYRFNAGSNLGFTNFSQQDLHTNIASHRNFVNWYPQASFSYIFTQQSRVSIRYNGVTTQPSIQQIQPIVNNEDPLNIYIGNPNLKPQFANNFSLFFNDYKVLSERSIYANLSATTTGNAISSANNVDSNGVKTNQSVNVNGNHSINAYFGYWFKWKKPGIDIGLNPSLGNTRNVNIVNKVVNVTNSSNYTFSLNLNKFKEKKYSLGIGGSATYTDSKSSLNTLVSTHYWTGNVRPDMDIFLPLKFQIHADCDFTYRQKTSVFDNNTNVTLLNVWIGKKIMKNDVLLIKASGNDLFDQNIGFSRTVSSNFISQNTYNTIRRYFMLSVVWNFTKPGTPLPQQ